jgi:hypothetical protein
MNSLFENPNDMIPPEKTCGTEGEESLLKKKTAKIKIMKTPCSHKYHIECLKAWMNHKLECPTCRAALPSLE